MADIKFGFFVPPFSPDKSPGSVFINQISNAPSRIERSIDSVWICDHFIFDDAAVLECWTLTSYLAAAYPNLDVGTIVLCQSYRNPALVAKMAATLQLLTEGHFILGIGAGNTEDEYLAYGYEFPRPAVRIQQLEEAVQIIRRMWNDSPASFEGKYYRIENAYCEPQPAPPIPIVIGWGGEKETLRVVAQHADWWNWAFDPSQYAQKLEVLKGHCEAVGRDFDSIVKTWFGVFAVAKTEAEAQCLAEDLDFPLKGAIGGVGTPEQVAGRLQEYIELGVTYFIVQCADSPGTAGIELFAEQVIPQFR